MDFGYDIGGFGYVCNFEVVFLSEFWFLYFRLCAMVSILVNLVRGGGFIYLLEVY